MSDLTAVYIAEVIWFDDNPVDGRRRIAVCVSLDAALQALREDKDEIGGESDLVATEMTDGSALGTESARTWAVHEHGINWNDYPAEVKRGRVCVRHTQEEDITYVDRRTQQETTTRAVRSRWVSEAAPHFTAEPGGWLSEVIPPLPSLVGP